MIEGLKMRSAIAMIELIFAIVIIAISIMSIPVMMNIAANSTQQMLLSDDAMTRLSGQMMDKFQARWGGEYVVDLNESTPNYISDLNSTADLRCLRTVGLRFYRSNPDSVVECNRTQTPRSIPALSTTDGGTATGDVANGLEMLNAGTEELILRTSTGETVDINATYNVRYVPSTVVMAGNTATATWRLGTSGTVSAYADNNGSLGVALADRTHLKRVSVRFFNTALGVDTTLTFFKSNIGGH